MPYVKRIGWAIYAAGFVIWLFGYLSAATRQHLIGTWPRRGGFRVSSPTAKQNSDLRSCSRAWSRFIGGQDRSARRGARISSRPDVGGRPAGAAAAAPPLSREREMVRVSPGGVGDRGS